MFSVILLMAGKGSRMNLDQNKILLPIGNKLMFEYSLDTFGELVDELVCVISKEDEHIIIPKLSSKIKIAYGGATRGESVRNGLMLCTNEYVLIHDAARPFISKEVINNILSMSNKNEAILTYLDVKDTIKENGDKLLTLNRNKLIAAVTPQCASLELLKDVYDKAYNDNAVFTDDISLIENYYPNVKINLVKANEECFKVTTPIDYELAKVIGKYYD